MKLYFKQRFSRGSTATTSTMRTAAWPIPWRKALLGSLPAYSEPPGEHIATVQQRVLTFLPKFELYVGDRCVGRSARSLLFSGRRFSLDFCGWTVDGSFMEWDYTIQDGPRQVVSHQQGAVPLDGYLHHRRGGPRRRAVRPDGGAGHRRGEMLAELKQTAPGGALRKEAPSRIFLPAVPFPQMCSGDFS